MALAGKTASSRLRSHKLGGPADAVAGSIVQKGYGTVAGGGDTNNLAMGYGTVVSGSAPAAGDLVCWIVFAQDTVGSPVVDLTGSGWVQNTNRDAGGAVDISILAKIVVAGDISSPPTVISGPDRGSVGLWVAYTVTGTPTLSANAADVNWGGAAAPSNVAVDSSALNSPDVAVTLAVATGTDGSIQHTWTGATEDLTATLTNAWNTATGDASFKAGADIGGVSVTLSKGDDGSANAIGGGYIGVDF